MRDAILPTNFHARERIEWVLRKWLQEQSNAKLR